MLWDINGSTSGLNGFALTHRWAGANAGDIKNQEFRESSYFKISAGAAGAPGVMAKDSGGGVRHRILSGGGNPKAGKRSDGSYQNWGILKNLGALKDSNPHFFTKPDILLQKAEGIQGRDIAGLEQWAKKIKDEVTAVTDSSAIDISFGLLGSASSTEDSYDWGRRSYYFREYLTLAWEKFSELVTTGAYLGKTKVNPKNLKDYYRNFWEDYINGV